MMNHAVTDLECAASYSLQLDSEGLVPGLISNSFPNCLTHHCVLQLQHCAHLRCTTHTHTHASNDYGITFNREGCVWEDKQGPFKIHGSEFVSVNITNVLVNN